MELSNQINPTGEKLKSLLSKLPQDQEVTMLNILRFNGHVESEGKSGIELYKRYSANVVEHLKAAKGKLIWKGEVLETVVGSEDKQPHMVLLVTYPTVSHFLNMIANPEYQKAAQDRSLALEYGGLVAMKSDHSHLG